MLISIYGKSHEVLWTNVGLLTFAIIFFIVGVTRVVEFKDLDFSSGPRRTLMAIHVGGTLCFSLALILLMADPALELSSVTQGLFLAAVFSLFPLHIYLAIRRKIRMDGDH